MIILNRKLYEKYKGRPLTIVTMFPSWVGLAEDTPVISFKPSNIGAFRLIFPEGKYKKI